MLTIDHAKLVRRDPAELKRFRSFLLGVRVGDVEGISIEHESDWSCCDAEPWEMTAATIVVALQLPTRLMMLNFP
jgi:hypothetical protein